MHGSGFLVGISNRWFRQLAEAGDAGVDLFFVLSGYLIASIAIKETTKSGSIDVPRFWFRRWMRTLPAYYCVLIVLWLGDFFMQAKGQWSPRWSFLLFLQTSIIPFETMRFSWSWSLCVEELFYFFFPILLFLSIRFLTRSPIIAIRVIAVLAILLSISIRFSLSSQGYVAGHTPGYAIPACRLDGIGIGLLISTLAPIKSYRIAFTILIASLLFCAIYVWNDSQYWWLKVHRYFPLSVFFGMLVHSLRSETFLRGVTFPGAGAISAISYSWYLVHPIVAFLVVKQMSHWPPLVAGVFFLLFSLVVSVGMRWMVELPGLWLRDRQVLWSRRQK